MNHTPRISAIVITLNEENNIRWCLESVHGWCNEIILVDMHSDDRTRDIAAEYTSHILLHERVPDFGRARQLAIDNASGEWVMVMDADEMTPKSLATKLIEIAQANQTDVVYIPRKDYMVGRWIQYGGWWPDYQPRFLRRTAVSYSGEVHSYTKLQPGSRRMHLDPQETYAMLHFNYHDVKQFVEKLNRYTSAHIHEPHWANTRATAWSFFLEFGKGFVGRYIKWKAYKDGMHGLVLSLLMGVYRMLIHIKIWEYQNGLTAETVDKMYDEVRQETIAGFKSNPAPSTEAKLEP